MNSELLLAHFNRISDAPDAVARLRKFILELAVRGKLVQQDAKDEPASQLLKTIHAEKLRLIKAGVISKQAPLAAIDGALTPFNVPSGWCWARLGTLSELVTSGSRDWAKYYSQEGAIFLRMGNLSRDSYRLRLSNIQHVNPPAEGEGSRTRLQEGDILISITGEVGLLGLIPADFGEAYINQHSCLVRPVRSLIGFFLPQLLISPFAQIQFNEPQRGLKNSFRLSDVTHLLVPLPPLAEQHRIAAKVDELMALCDRLETTQRERETCRDQLTASTHHHLNNGGDGEELRTHAQFFIGHLPRLTTRSDQIKHLRQTILNLAVRGQLVPQDPCDEPARNLLERVRREKSRLAKAGLIREEKALPAVNCGDFFGLPRGWAWSRWESIAFKIGDIDHKMPETVSNGVPFISPRDFLPGNQINFEGAKRVSLEDFSRLSAKIRAEVGDLIYPRYGTIGENRLVTENRDFLVSYSCAVIKVLHGFVDPQYQYVFSISSLCKDQARAAENKTTQANVGIKSIQEYVVPLPPLAEQHRIVAKVDELMSLCDQLEASLAAAQTEASRLLESVLHHALQNPAVA